MNDRSKLLNLIVKDIFNGVTADEVVEIMYQNVAGLSMPVGLKIGRRELSTEEIVALKQDAISIRTSLLWELMVKRIQYIAQLKSCERAETNDDVVFPKAILYAVQEIQRVLEIVQAFQVENAVVAKKNIKK